MSDLLSDRRDKVDIDEDEQAARRLKKAEKGQDTRPLDPWERYRALTDLLDTYVDMIEIADRKTRFALVILGALNALNLVVAARPRLFASGEIAPAEWVGAYAAIYITISLYLVIQAIGVLRPRASMFLGKSEHAAPDSTSLPGTRFIGDVVTQTADQYYDTWHRVAIGQLSREVALHVQSAARINNEKYQALGRLYTGLTVLAILTVTIVVLLVVRGFGA